MLMIEQNMVEWLVARLRGECERLYSLEYSTALLLNLCLHVEARERCPESVLKLLTDLLDTGQIQVTLYLLCFQCKFKDFLFLSSSFKYSIIKSSTKYFH